ncbi:MAG: hypothetical protein R2795_18830 [Saprospiraceae bacterium]
MEKNRNTLASALQQLPTYMPPEGLWQRIADGIGQATPDEGALQDAIQELPGHTPPAKVWNALAKELDSQQVRVVKLRQYRRWGAVAASVAVLAVAGWWITREPSPLVSIQYAQETVHAFDVAVDWNTDEDTFDRLEAMLGQIDNPVVNKLKAEYEELTMAHKDVEDMLRNYGKDPQLVRQMADIERERTDIYRQIIELI